MISSSESPWFEGHHYLRRGYRGTRATRSNQDHWLGGPPRHKNAVCRGCGRALLLLWDIACAPLRIAGEKRSLLGAGPDLIALAGLDRLPLYYCWNCADWISYRIKGASLEWLGHGGSGENGDWYHDYPLAFERQPLELTRIPRAIEKILLVKEQVGRAWFTSRDCRRIDAWLGGPNPPTSKYGSILRHQLGGLPPLAQGHERHECVNPECKWKGYSAYTMGGMKELASIHNDPRGGLPMTNAPDEELINEFVQVVFWICPECSSIRADQRCD